MVIVAGDQLPTELLSSVVDFCDSKDLPKLALASKELQVLAERQLYASIVVESRSGRSVRALSAVAGSVSRAPYVSFLSIEINRFRSHPVDQSIIETFLRAAPAMSGIKDLRIRLRAEQSPNINHLNDVLCAGHFQLTTLFVDEELDVPRIVKEQKELDVVMIRSTSVFRSALPSLLPSPTNRPLIVLGLAQEPTVFPVLNHIALAPELASPDHATLSDLVKAAFNRDVMREYQLDFDAIHTVSVFLTSPAAQWSVAPYVKCAMELFPRVNELQLHLPSSEEPLETPFVEPLLWASIEDLVTWPWEEDPGNQNYRGLRWGQSDAALGHCLLKWRSACPNLRCVMFGGSDGFTVDQQSNWVIRR